MKTPRRCGRLAVDLLGCFVLPAYTLLFAGARTWFGTNFSVIAVTGRDHYRGFLLLGLLAMGYFSWTMLTSARRLPRRGQRMGAIALTLEACLSLIYAMALPYLPEFFPRVAALHVGLAAQDCVLLMAALLLMLLTLERREPGRYRKLLWAWAGIAGGSAVLFLIPRMVSSALEVFFTISAALLARALWIKCGA